jgi:hypothetical protein
VRLLVLAVGGDDEVENRPTDRLVRGIAEDALRAAVPGEDDAVERFADDGVVGRFDDGRELRADLVDGRNRIVLGRVGSLSHPALRRPGHRRIHHLKRM